MGTAFTVLWPAVEVQAAPPAETNADGAGGESERILLVDDEEDLLDAVQQMLERMGHSVVSCTRGARALKIFEKTPDRFSLIITDYAMPAMSGKELAQKIKKIRPEMPILLCTGYCGIMDEETREEMGFGDVIYKPVRKEELGQSIRKVLQKEGVPA